MIAKGERLAPHANPEDAEEIRQLIEKLQAAIQQRAQTDMEEPAAKLEDIVFYLQDV